MPEWVGLLRGVNVGGRNKLPMAQLSALFESLGYRNVRTYIQSGNVVFGSTTTSAGKLGRGILDAIEESFGFRPDMVLLNKQQFRTAIRNNPFADAVSAPKTLHFYFLDSQPKNPDLDGLAKLSAGTEHFQLIDSVFYLHTPDGFGTSRLAGTVEKKLGVSATARNFNTIQAIDLMISDA
ncbi:MAG: DUF1697 domain-containing protein [Planctomyces sp.]|nr:DUF1697 domain-containing protein [Planctomyces sp.]